MSDMVDTVGAALTALGGKLVRRPLLRPGRTRESVPYLPSRPSEALRLAADGSARFGTWEWDIPTDTVRWSAELKKIHGLSPTETPRGYQAHFAKVRHSNDDETARLLRRSLETGAPYESEERIVRPDGRERVLYSLGKVVTDQYGQPMKMFGICVDVTERREAERRLREREWRYKQIIEKTNEGVWVIDAEGRTKFANARMAAILGCTFDELLASSITDFADDTERAQEVFNVERHMRGVSEQHEVRFVRADGSPVWVLVETSPMFDDAGVFHGVLAMVFLGIDELMATQLRLAKSRQRFATFFHQMPVACGLSRLRDGRIIEVNERWSKLTGYSREEALGRTKIDLGILQRSQRDELVERLATAGFLSDVEVDIVTKSGAKRCVLATMQRVELEGGPYILGSFVDVTARKRADLGRERAMSLLSATLDATADGILVVDREGTIASCNTQFREMCRLPDSVLRNGRDAGALDSVIKQLEAPEEFVRKVRALQETPEAASHDVLRCREGRILEAHSRPRWLGREIVGRVWSFQDVTRRHNALQALEDSERYHRALTENLQDIITILDADGTIRYASGAATRMLGYDPGALVGQNSFDLIHPDDRESVKQILEGAVRTRGASVTAEYRFRHKSGLWRVLEAVGKNLLHDPVVAGVVVTSRDITERKRDQEEVAASIRLLKSTLESMDDAVFIVDPKTLRIWMFNGAAGRMFGYAPEELLGATTDALHASAKASREFARRSKRALERGEPYRGEFRMKRKDGSIFYTEHAVTAIDPAAGYEQGVVSVVRDVTERKQRERAMASLRRISQLLNSTLQVEPLLDALVTESINLIHAESGCAGVRTNDGMIAKRYHQRGVIVDVDCCWPRDTGLPGWLIDRKCPFVANDVPGNPRIRHALYERFGVRSAIAIPVLDSDGQPIAFFEIHNKRDGSEITARDRELLVTVANAASSGIQNAQAYQRLRKAQGRLTALSRRLLRAQEEERRRIARELHDDLGQPLTAIKMQLQRVAEGLDDSSDVRRHLDDAMASVYQAFQSLRSLALDLRPTMLDDLGLVLALRAYLRRQRDTAGLDIEVDAPDTTVRVDPDIETAAYRIVQEAVTNVTRHASTNHVRVSIQPYNGTLEVVVRDEGVGFDVEQARAEAAGGAHLGITSMTERAALAGGRLTIDSVPGQGTSVKATFPTQRIPA